MAEFRTLHVKIWKDEWFCGLKPDAKLLFIYLVTNEAATIAGIYKLPEKFIVFESGLGPTRVRKIMGEFSEDGKVYSQGGIVWVVNLRRYQTFDGRANDNVKKRIQKDIEDIPDGELKRRYLAYYCIPMVNPSDTHDMPLSDPKIPMFGPQIPIADTDTDTDTDIDKDIDTDKEKDTMGAGAPAPPAEKGGEQHPLSLGQREFLEAFGAKRFKTNVQREAVQTLEKTYGMARLKECITWAAKRGMGLGEALSAIETAIPKWGQPKPNRNGNKPAGKGWKDMSQAEIDEFNRLHGKLKKPEQPA